MTTGALQLHVTRHPHKQYKLQYEQIIGLEEHQKQLLGTLQLILDHSGLKKWKDKHHPKGKMFIDTDSSFTPLIILSGDVGCGKTELATSIATPLAHAMGNIVIHCFETPSDIRGGGHVGELSARITAAFEQAHSKLPKGEHGVLIIDEADDLATSRSQNQAHHEDRAGVNVLIKEVERISRDKINLAVIMITNRFDALDPAVIRRASLHLEFKRPKPEHLKPMFEYLLMGIETTDAEYKKLIDACKEKTPLFSFSDIRKRVANQALIAAMSGDEPLSAELLLDIISKTNPSPSIL